MGLTCDESKLWNDTKRDFDMRACIEAMKSAWVELLLVTRGNDCYWLLKEHEEERKGAAS